MSKLWVWLIDWCLALRRDVLDTTHYVIKLVSDLWQVCGFLIGNPVSTTNKTDHHDITEILSKVALNKERKLTF